MTLRSLLNSALSLFSKAPSSLSPVPTLGMAGFFGFLREPWAGAWQEDAVPDTPSNLLMYSPVYACVTIIAGDVSKCFPRLMKYDTKDKIWVGVENTKYPVLKKPNEWQNIIKFVEQYILSKLLHGNAYVLKRRDGQGNVVAWYLLDPTRVKPAVASDRSVWYQLNTDNLSGVMEPVIAPASEIVHDMMAALWHPLVGISPLYACAMAATVANKIHSSSIGFFANAARPSGVLTAPGEIKDSTATRLKEKWENNFSGNKSGRVAILGDGLKYEPMTMTASDAQVAEIMKLTAEDVARAFHMPMYKLGGPTPSLTNIEALNQDYYSNCLQGLIENLELCWDEGLNLPDDLMLELDLNNLFRMDSATRYERHNKAVAGGWFAPNEARALENLPPVRGGEFPMMQQQNWNLGQLADRPAPADKPSVAPPPPVDNEEEEDEENEELEAMADVLIAGLQTT